MSGFSSLKYKHVKHCSTHPKFLHSNSTSHRWAFGAIAELIDNAIDPDVNASQFCIDLKEFNNEPCLVLMDNGCGLTPERLHKMLSFGHSKKQLNPGDRSIGKHGNGFKSGTMRLGKDVLVLTKCTVSMTAGFLSQTFLAAVGAEDILIPLVSWDLHGNRLTPKHADIEESLQAICTYSIFPDEASLLAQLDAIPGTGTILIISNLRRHEGVLEMDYKTDPHDIRITSEITSSHYQQLRPNQPHSTDVPSDYSLRAYVSILYKVPRMQIFIRDNKVKTKRISGILSQKVMETYRPMGVSEPVKIEMGFNTENRSLYGMMLYHRNRLIKPYMRVGMQLEENERGMGVLGIVEADFLQPTHNKQDFDDTTAYRRLLKKLSDVLAEYWWEKKERVTTLSLPPPETPSKHSVETETAEDDVPDVVWVQCDNPSCLKWRILPEGTDPASLSDSWFCEYHPDPKYRRHEEAEQEWDMSVQHEIIERRRERKREYDREKKEKEAHKRRQRLEVIVGKEEQIVIQRQREALKKELEEQRARDALALDQERKIREEEVLRLQKELEEMQAKRDRIQEQHNELLKQMESDARRKSAGSKRPADDNHVQLSEHEISQVGVSGSEDLSEERPVDSKKNEEASSTQQNGVLRLEWKEANNATDTERVSHQPLNQVADGNGPLQSRPGSFISLQTGNEGARISYPETVGLDGRVLEESRPDQHQQSHSAVHDGDESVLSNKRSRVAVNEPNHSYNHHHRHHPLTLLQQQESHLSIRPSRNLDEQRDLMETDIVDTSGGQVNGSRQNPAGGTGLQDMPPAFHHSKQQFSTEEMTGSHGKTLGPLSSFQNVNMSPTEGGRSLFQDGGRNLLSGAESHPVQYPLPVVPIDRRLAHGTFTEKLPDCPPSGCSDPMVVAAGSLTPRREAESSLVLSLQGRLRMALKTLLKLAGPTEVQSDVEGMLLTDLEVVTVCEKAKALVGMRWQAYEQEIAKLKTELAYTLADKLQQTGQGFRIRALSGDSNWEPGMLK